LDNRGLCSGRAVLKQIGTAYTGGRLCRQESNASTIRG
jgi:hypothetical protein